MRRPRLSDAQIELLIEALKTHIIVLRNQIREARKQGFDPRQGYNENVKALSKAMTDARSLRIFLKRLLEGKGGRRPWYGFYADHGTLPSSHYEDDLELR